IGRHGIVACTGGLVVRKRRRESIRPRSRTILSPAPIVLRSPDPVVCCDGGPSRVLETWAVRIVGPTGRRPVETMTDQADARMSLQHVAYLAFTSTDRESARAFRALMMA